MKLPSWLRATNTRQINAREVRVTLTADTTRFDRVMANASTGLLEQTEAVSRRVYADRLDAEHDQALFHLDDLLDDWCRELGTTREAVSEEKREAARARRRAGLIARQDPGHPNFIGRRV